MSGLPPFKKRKFPAIEAQPIQALPSGSFKLVSKNNNSTAMEIKKTEEEMKQELWILANEMVADDFVDNQKLIKISDLVKRLKPNSDFHTPPVPKEFMCPISKDVMRDPVVIVSGYTFERSFIEPYLNSGKKKCPVSGQELYDARLIPNHALRQQISNWCDEIGEPRITASSPSASLPPPVDPLKTDINKGLDSHSTDIYAPFLSPPRSSPGSPILFPPLSSPGSLFLSPPGSPNQFPPEYPFLCPPLSPCSSRSVSPCSSSSPPQESQKLSATELDELIAKLPSCSLQEAKSATQELRHVKQFVNRALIICRREAIDIGICSVIMSRDLNRPDPEFDNDLLTLVHNLSQIRQIKTVMAEQDLVIFFLTESLMFGPTEARTKAATTLATLNINHNAAYQHPNSFPNNTLILNLGVIKALTELLKETKQKDALQELSTAIVQICGCNQKLTKTAFMEGMHRVVVVKMEGDLDFAEELVSVLSLFSRTWKVEMREIRVVQLLVRIVRESSNQVAEKNAAEILNEICGKEIEADLDESLMEVCSTSYFPFDYNQES